MYTHIYTYTYMQVVSFLPNGPVGKCEAIEIGDLLVAIDSVETNGTYATYVHRGSGRETYIHITC